MRHGRAIAPLIALSALTAQGVLAGPGTTTTLVPGGSTTSTTLAPGTTTTTVVGTTVPSTSTTTTLPPCTVEPTFGSADCRLDDLLEQVGTEDDLGKLQEKLVRALERAESSLGDAQAACDAGDQRVANKKLRKAVRRLIQYGHKLRTLGARRKVPDELRTELVEEGQAIQQDLVTIKRSGVCPPASPSGAFS